MTEFNVIKLECPEFLNNAIAEPSKEIGKTLGNIFYTIFSPINYTAEKLRIKQAKDLKKYQDDIQNEISKISEEKLTEPKLSIVGPALEASKFYIEEEDMRKMFAKLIASSMNTDTASKSHNSFVEIIKQLSPLDASNLKILQNKGDKTLPIAQYILKKDKSFNILKTHVFIENHEMSDLDKQSSSISNLIRLGLFSVDYENTLLDENLYSVFEQHPIYIDYDNYIKQNLVQDPDFKFKSIYVKKGIVALTSIGLDFASVCI